MQWIVDNWVIMLLVGGMLDMHLFGHGHGGHEKQKSKKSTKVDDPATPHVNEKR